MKIIVIKTQEELNALPGAFNERTVIEIRSNQNVWLRVDKKWGSAHVEARESAHVEARESAHVVARESAHVVARGSAHVVAWGRTSVQVSSANVAVTLFAFAIAIIAKQMKATIHKKSKTAMVHKVGKLGWFEENGIEIKESQKNIILFKRVSKDWLTQEGEEWETDWRVGTTLEHSAWNPTESECGKGKYHACSRPYFCDQFRSKSGDRYIAIKIVLEDLYEWPDADYPHKIAFRKGTVMYECDRYGMEIEVGRNDE